MSTRDWIKNPVDEIAVDKYGCYFDEDAGNHVCDFLETFCKLSKAKWRGKPLELQDWQRNDLLMPLFGWKQADGLRRFRLAFIFIPKKNGKSALSSGIALYLGMADGEGAPEVYMAANDRGQAGIVFNEAKEMVKFSPALSKRCKIRESKSEIRCPDGGLIKVVSSESYTSEGLNISGLIYDEIHAAKNRDLWDALKDGGVSRDQPLMINITTAGHDKNTICYEQYSYAKKVLSGATPDITFFPLLYGLEQDDDWRDRKNWFKANPSLGVTIKESDFEKRVVSADNSPVDLNAFKRYRLNIWTSSDVAWINDDQWALGDSPDFTKEDLLGQTCYGGIDLGSVSDLCSLTLYFPLWDAMLSWSWIPKENAYKRAEKNHAPYLEFIEDGCLKATEGNVADYDVIREDVNELGNKYDIQIIGTDPWNSVHLTNLLTQDGFEMASFRQGFGSMSAPSKEFQKLVLGNRIFHFGDPLLKWCASNVTVETDAAGNIKPSKKKSPEKIDPIVAGVMAVGLGLISEPESESVYEERGALVF